MDVSIEIGDFFGLGCMNNKESVIHKFTIDMAL